MDLQLNFKKVFDSLLEKGMKPTQIANAIGFTSTTQIYNTIEGKSLLSTKAIMGMIKNLSVDPKFIFLGEGDMFLSDESELEKLQKENRQLIHNNSEALTAIMKLNEIIKELERKNDNLIELSNAAKEYYKSQLVKKKSSEIRSISKDEEWEQVKVAAMENKPKEFIERFPNDIKPKEIKKKNIIEVLNKMFEINLTEDDRLFIDQLENNITENEKLANDAKSKTVKGFKSEFTKTFFSVFLKIMDKNKTISKRIIDDEDFSKSIKNLLMENVYNRLRED